MRKFEFSLQTALDLRRREEQAAHQRLAEAQRVAEGIETRLRDARVRYLDAVAAVRQDIMAQAPADDGRDLALAQVAHAENYLSRLRDTIRLHRERLQEATRTCELRRGELITAMQRRKSLERLRERREYEHRRSEVRREDRLLDEIAVTSSSGRMDRALHGARRAADRAA